MLPRRRDMVHTAYGDVAVKRCLLDSGERCYVEYDSAAKLAQEQGVPLQDIYLAAQLAQKKHKLATKVWYNISIIRQRMEKK